MDFNNVFLPKIEPSDQPYRADAVAVGSIAKSGNLDADFSGIENQVDHLFTKVDKIEVELKEVEEFYANVVKKELQNDFKGVMVKGRNSLTSLGAKKNQTRAVAARRRHELKMRQDKGSGYLEAEAEVKTEIQLAQEVAHARTARKISTELHEMDRLLGELREIVLQKSRKFSVDEKRKLSLAFTKLSPEHLIKALDIAAQSNSNFTGVTDEIDLDMDNLSESTLWRLKIFVKEALKNQGSTPTANAGCDKDEDKNTINNKCNKKIYAALVKNKKRKKVDTMDK